MVLLLFILLWSLCLGCGLALSLDAPKGSPELPVLSSEWEDSFAEGAFSAAESLAIEPNKNQTYLNPNLSPESDSALFAQVPSTTIGTIDVVPSRYQLGKELYLENCASCHVAIPPEVFPTETWRRLLQEQNQHYGKQLKPLTGPSLLVMWDYLRTFSRPGKENESVPYRMSESRFFKALHPRVDVPQTTKVGSCVSCHPGAVQFNYRELSSEWENSP
jgi:hypothetical protein